MNLRDRDYLELDAIYNDALAARLDAEDVMFAVQQERAYRKDLKLAEIEEIARSAVKKVLGAVVKGASSRGRQNCNGRIK